MNNKFQKRIFSQSEIDDFKKADRVGKFVNIGIFLGLIGLTLFAFFSGVFSLDHKPEPTTSPIVQPTEKLIQPTSTNKPEKNSTQTSSSNNITQSPIETSTITPTTKVQFNSTAQISCESVDKVNLRKSPGYLDKDDDKDVIYEVPCGEYVNLLGESIYSDKLTWWKVSWNSSVGWIADHTGKGRKILSFEQLPLFSSSNPTGFINWYFNALWQERNYDILWNTYLTPQFQSHSSPGGIIEYSDWWKSVKQVDVHSIDVLQNDGQNAWIKIQVTFYLSDGRVLNNRSYEYDLTFHPEKKIWMFDYHS